MRRRSMTRTSASLAVILLLVILAGVAYLPWKKPLKPTPKPTPTLTPRPRTSPSPKPGPSKTPGSSKVEEIPHICHKPKNWNGKAIIFVHGLGGNKEVWVDDMKAFEELGYSTFSFDLPFHGERGRFQGAEQLPDLIRQGSEEIVSIAGYLREEGASEVYLISRSLGSIVSAVALGKEAKIDKAVLLLASADLQYVFKYGSIEEEPSWIDDVETLREIDPLYFLPNYTGRIHFHLGKRDSLLTPEAGVFAYNAAILSRERKIIWHDRSHSMPLSEYFDDTKEFFESEEFEQKVSELVKGALIPSTGGDGVCGKGESWENSPFDCKKKVLLIAFQLHIEEVVEGKPYDSDRAFFEEYAGTLERLASLFEKHGAKISIQTEKNFAIADVKFGRYILKELKERGHGVGVQSHMGHHITELHLNTDEKKLLYTLEVKEAVSRAIGCEPTNIGGGFEMENVNLLGVVEGGLGFTSMTAVEKPYNARTKKAPKWLHPWILPSTQMMDLSDPSWLAHDPGGSIVYIPGWYANEVGFEIDCRKDENCFELATQSLYRALEDADCRFINVWWFSSHLYQTGRKEEEVERVLDAYDKWLTEVVDPLVKQGKVKWMNFDEIAEFYLKWEKERYLFTSTLTHKSVDEESCPVASCSKGLSVFPTLED
ncbi:MAG: hypothetical protein DRN90_06330 [Thermoproteota archaeon]|nr:MAG: hypothetical protein DRN90_06330 [Candidatus Korarchaeota archaeon]